MQTAKMKEMDTNEAPNDERQVWGDSDCSLKSVQNDVNLDKVWAASDPNESPQNNIDENYTRKQQCTDKMETPNMILRHTGPGKVFELPQTN